MESLRSYLLAFGIPGLFAIAFIDSAGIPLPGGVDLVVMLLAWQRPEFFVPVAFVAAIGSTAGCWMLYRISNAAGKKMLKRFSSRKQELVIEKLRRNDMLAMFVAMLGPPPFPTKLFILIAGVIKMDWRRFIAAVFIGRLIRYFAGAYLAMRVGDRAVETLQQHYSEITIVLVVSVVVFVAVRRVLNRSGQTA